MVKKKCYSVSGKKYGKQKFKVFTSFKQAKKYFENKQFEKGWKDLGVSKWESCKDAKKIEGILKKI